MGMHTPGKWVARKDPHGGPSDYCIGLDDDCSPVDYVAVCNKRDAALIAAAKEMLAALKDAIDTAVFERHPYRAWHEAARAAIAKATGATP